MKIFTGKLISQNTRIQPIESAVSNITASGTEESKKSGLEKLQEIYRKKLEKCVLVEVPEIPTEKPKSNRGESVDLPQCFLLKLGHILWCYCYTPHSTVLRDQADPPCSEVSKVIQRQQHGGDRCQQTEAIDRSCSCQRDVCRPYTEYSQS